MFTYRSEVKTLSNQIFSADADQTEELRAELSRLQDALVRVTAERDQLRASHERLRLELELLRRRIYVAKAERIDTKQLELEFAEKLAELDRIAGIPAGFEENPDSSKEKKKRKPTGRRDLRKAPIQEVRIELSDPCLDALVETGEAERIGFEESCKLAYQRGGYRRLLIARAKYKTLDPSGTFRIDTVPMPPQCFERSLVAPSALSHIITDKFCDGLPLNRIEDRAHREGIRLDRGTMSRWVEDAGATLGATVISAARKDAFEKAFCIATDATGISVQPEPRADKKRQSCRKGHYHVLLADKDHVFFEYTPRETSEIAFEMFEGYSGYIQADAKSVYDILFRKPDKPPDDDEESPKREEVGCWSHCRRKFWEATCAKMELGREGLARIGRLFTLEEVWKNDPPEVIHRMRNAHLRPHMEAFFEWAEAEYEKIRKERGLLRSALGYAVRQKGALMRVLDDGRLVLENNRSERELRRIAVGRKNWLFVGSDGHAESSGHLLSAIASARLHGLNPEAYLRDVFRVLAHWPRDRYLELAPKYWTATRARLNPDELAMELGPLTVPEPLAALSE